MTVTTERVQKCEIMEPFGSKILVGSFNQSYNHCCIANGINNMYFAYC